jgi:Polyketide cyclase / dehydrase and lipid transport
MASIRKEIHIDRSAEDVWDALRDWGALHVRLAPGFVTDTRLDGEDRIVTFFTGTVMREVLIDRDDAARRLAWTIVDEPYAHHNGVAQVFSQPDGTARFVWVTDLLPHELAEPTAEMMDRGLEAVRQTLQRAVVGG